MNLPKKVNYALLSLLAVINIVFRYPITNHEIGVDSFAMHSLINSITRFGFDRRIASPLSLFGLYPHSSPTGALFTLSGFSQLTGIDTEHSILLVATFLGILGALGTYLFAKEILDDDIFAFSSAMLYSLSRTFLGFTMWTYSTRGLLVALLPIFMWILMRIYKDTKNRLKYISLSIIMLVILVSIHRMAFFILFILMAFVISIIAFKIFTNLRQRIKFPKKTPIISSSIVTFLLVFLFIIPLSAWAFYGVGTKEALAEGQYFIKGSGLIVQLLQMGILYAMAFGILIILAPIGYFYILRKAAKRYPNIFMISILFFFTFFWTDWIYARTFFILYIALFSGMGLLAIAKFAENKLKKKYLIPIGVILLLLIAVSLPIIITIPHGQKTLICTTELREETYNAGLYLRYHNDAIVFSNDGSVASKIDAFSGTNPHKIPDYFNKSKLERVPFKELISGEYDYLYKEKKPRFGYHVTWYPSLTYSVFLNPSGCNSPVIRKALEYNLQGNGMYYVAVMSYLGNNITWKDPSTFEYVEKESPFLVNLHEKTYKIYDDGFEHVMFLNYPKGE